MWSTRTLLWKPSFYITGLAAVLPVWLNFKENFGAPVSLTALTAVLKDNESRLSDWPLYPRAYERASAELTPVSWFPPGEPVVVLSPRLNCVWTLLKHYKITQYSLKCERGPKTFIPSLHPSLFKCHHYASTYTADSTDQNVQNAKERLLILLQIQNTALIFSI